MAMELTANALKVLELRYLRKDAQGHVIETPEQMFERVAHAVALAEGRKARTWSKRYFELMTSLRFLPNSPTLMNAGRDQAQLSACFVLPLRDSLESVFDTLKQAALIHQSGGGTGFDFSELRPAGAPVKSTHGVASGPVSFIRIFDTATETIKQGGTRRGANMAILRVDHPDIEGFIDAKRDLRSITNFNVSVGVTDAFMAAVERGTPFSLMDPQEGHEAGKVDARTLFRKIAQSAWECGDPGLVFLDRINRFNPTPDQGPMASTNPCGEQPLLAFESCNLGSLNLAAYVQNGVWDWTQFLADIPVAVRFLDAVIDVNHYPVAACAKVTRKNRKIGLGVMGFADALLLLGIRYDSRDAVLFGERVMSVLDRAAKAASSTLAKEKGAFPAARGAIWKRLGYPALRNATVSTVAPTGTISMIAGVSSGIEPIFAGVFQRNVLGGAKLQEVHPAVRKLLSKRESEGALSEADLSRLLGPAWQPAYQVSVEGHLQIQAAFQRHSDSAVSKTINLHQSASVDQVEQAYRRAYLLGCKGITVYRDQSRPSQVLEVKDSGSVATANGQACENCDL